MWCKIQHDEMCDMWIISVSVFFIVFVLINFVILQKEKCFDRYAKEFV